MFIIVAIAISIGSMFAAHHDHLVSEEFQRHEQSELAFEYNAAAQAYGVGSKRARKLYRQLQKADIKVACLEENR